MIFNNPYWSLRSKLDSLARWLIVHSIIYYELGTSIVSDKMFDDNARQYIEFTYLDKQLDITKTRWHYVLFDFDGNTGFDLFRRLNTKDKKRLLHEAANLVLTFGDKGAIIYDRLHKNPIKK